MDRRALFFLGSSVFGFLLIPVADPEHRWVAVLVGVTYLVLALASALDKFSRDRVQARFSKRR